MAEKRFEKVYSQGTLTTAEVYVDKETGVNYLFMTSGYAGGLTPAAGDGTESLSFHLWNVNTNNNSGPGIVSSIPGPVSGKIECLSNQTLFPPAGEEVDTADEEGHIACEGIAQPEAHDTHVHCKPHEHGQTDPADDTIQKSYNQIQPGVSAAVDHGQRMGNGRQAI